MTTATPIVEQFREALATVAELGPQLAESERALAADEAAILTEILANLRRVMRYIHKPIRASGHCPGGQFSHWTYTKMAEKGIVLAGELERECNGDQNRGTYQGHDLILSTSGTLWYRTFAGFWSRWQGESESWTALPDDPSDRDEYAYDEEGYLAPTAGSSVQVTVEQALAHYTLEQILSGIADSFATATKEMQTKTAVLASRRAQVQQIQALLAAE